ncbi:hypothetical protein EJ06DRAFT_541989 [Trichodelitschia bisporula]|uniref:Uncharacterized protein n=1 Tax=Trichodelitschia bisporula TaxID=703511 RepID=A0A6G1I1G6_9PEZI|nr:hypothetical protein EJ06DRAFT_541989 [Trichodelitschia bisporula]
MPTIVSRLVHAPGLYPLIGIVYFASHPPLYPLLRARLLPATLLTLFILLLLFTFTYLPQVAFLALIRRGASAWINGTFLVLAEGAAIAALLFEAFLVDETQVDIFDAVLVAHGLDELVALSRPVAPSEDGDYVERLGQPMMKCVYAPFSFRQIAEFILLLPLNLLPYVGVPAFLLLTGYRAGPLLHHRYFALRGFGRRERRAWVKKYRWGYTWFGTVALVLQLVPGLSMLFLLTSAAGSGMWAARMEKIRLREEGAAESTVREGTVNGLRFVLMW